MAQSRPAYLTLASLSPISISLVLPPAPLRPSSLARSPRPPSSRSPSLPLLAPEPSSRSPPAAVGDLQEGHPAPEPSSRSLCPPPHAHRSVLISPRSPPSRPFLLGLVPNAWRPPPMPLDPVAPHRRSGPAAAPCVAGALRLDLPCLVMSRARRTTRSPPARAPPPSSAPTHPPPSVRPQPHEPHRHGARLLLSCPSPFPSSVAVFGRGRSPHVRKPCCRRMLPVCSSPCPCTSLLTRGDHRQVPSSRPCSSTVTVGFHQVRLQHKDMCNYADSPSTTTHGTRQVHLRACPTTPEVDNAKYHDDRR